MRLLQTSKIVISSFVLITISGCANTLLNTVSHVLPKEAENKEPLRKLNPNPQQAYKVYISIKNAPGDFQNANGTVQFDVENPSCGKKHSISGVVPRISSNETFDLKKVSASQYEGIFYSDMILDGDYYQRGLCKWKLTEARVVYSNTENGKTRGYLTYISSAQIASEGTNTLYYWNGYYSGFSSSLDRFVDFGNKDMEKVPQDKKNEFFTITMSAKKL